MGESTRPDANVADLSFPSPRIPLTETSHLLASSARQQLWSGRAEVSDASEWVSFVPTLLSIAKRTSVLTRLGHSLYKAYEKIPILPWS